MKATKSGSIQDNEGEDQSQTMSCDGGISVGVGVPVRVA